MEESSAGGAPSALCCHCRSAFRAPGIGAMLLAQPGFVHHKSGDLEESANRGCGLCQLILEQEMLSRTDDSSYECILLFSDDEDEPSRGDIMTTLGIWPYPRRDAEDRPINLYLRIFAPETSLLRQFLPARPIEDDVTTSGVISSAKKLITECRRDHERCKTSTALPRLPPRVLDIGKDGDSSMIRLRITDPAGEHDEYVTLSYCWGGPQPIVTARDTLDQRKKGIEVASLPRTLQDAVSVTRTMGFRYLWVDALCIVQDDDDDKMAEIAKMDEVYGNCTLCVTAAVAETVYEGFIDYERAEPRCAVPAELPTGEWCEIFVAPCLEAEFNELPLQTRGWTLQEWLLPPRILLYGHQELVFQCREGGTRGVCPSYISYHDANWKTSRIVDHAAEVPLPAARGASWILFLREYTARKFTVSTDRLHGMTGIVNVLRSSWQDECVAGLWRSTFPMCLAWQCRERVQPPPEKRTGWAPSWSWLSIETPVTVDLELYKHLDKADAELLSVTGEELRLTCRVIPMVGLKEMYVCHRDIKGETGEREEFGIYLGLNMIASQTKFQARMLVVVEDKDDKQNRVYRRVGWAGLEDYYGWKHLEKRDVILV